MTARDRRLAAMWDRGAAGYDTALSTVDRRFLSASREWVCSRAYGSTLEVAIGTGLNLPYYPSSVDQITAVEWSPAMASLAARRSERLGRRLRLVVADAMRLPFPDESFDSVVCTFALCCIPREDVAVHEMIRVLKPGGLLLLADHVAARPWPVRLLQRLVDLVTVPTQGEHWSRRPLLSVTRMGLEIVATEAHTLGVIERVHARKQARLFAAHARPDQG